MRSTSKESTAWSRGGQASAVGLLMGDVLAFLIFVVVGRASHGFSGDWLINIARIVTPFLIGWFVVAFPLGAYQVGLLQKPGRVMVRSVLALLIGDGIAFALRGFLFQDNVTVPFALTSIAFTGLFVVGWRAVYLWWCNR